MKETYADIEKSKEMLNEVRPKANLSNGKSNFISWFKNYHNN